MKVEYIKGRTLEVDGKNIDDMNAYEQAAIILKVANKIVLKKQSHKHKLKSLLICSNVCVSLVYTALSNC